MRIKHQKMLYLIFLISLLLTLVSCSSPTKRVINQAKNCGWQEKRYPINNSFIISTYGSPFYDAKEKIIRVYIEGDGSSWKNKYQLSSNPTPKHPLTLKLALTDPHASVIYLARPCQYTPHRLDKKCEPKYWSSHRYAPEVIDAMNLTLDKIKVARNNQSFVLIGYSGGASIAALIAAKRTDVKGLITFAGDLDHQILNEHHQTTPLTGSENPIHIARKLKNLPQQHWAGAEDKIVPPWMSQHFAKAVNNPLCVKTFTLAGVTHHKGWEEAWPQVLQTPLMCD